MAVIVNDRDVLLQAAAVRFVRPLIPIDQVDGLEEALDSAKGIRIDASATTFIGTGGTTNPATITLTAVLGGLSGTVDWSVIAGSATLQPNGNTCVVVGSSVVGYSVTIRARLTGPETSHDAQITLNRLGSLSVQETVSLTNQVTGQLAAGNVSGLGALALLNTVDLNTQTTGALNGMTRVTNLGALAYANAIAANQIGAGTLAAGVIYAGNINASQVTAGTFTGLTFQTSPAGSQNRVLVAASDNSLRVTINGLERVKIGGDSIGQSYIYASAAVVPAIYATSETSGVAAIWGSTAATGASGIYGSASGGGAANGVRGHASGAGVGVDATANSSSTLNHAIRGRQQTRFSAGLIGAANGYSFYAEEGAGYGPFTGAHDALIANSVLPSLSAGDIVVDMYVVTRRGVSDVLTEVEPSSSPNQRGAVGVFNLVQGSVDACEPAAMLRGDQRDDDGLRTQFCRTRTQYAGTHTLIAINSLGEGQINVCGEGGDIAIGDLIVCSSMPGKGMRQADDIVRSYTVARAREAVTFTGPDDVHLVACIYLCG